MNETTETKEKYYSIKDGAVYMKLTPFRVRRLIHEGRLETVLVPVKPGSKVNKHMITKTSIDLYQSTKSRRKDGRIQYIIRLSENESVLVEKFMKETLKIDEVEVKKRFEKKVK